MWGDESSLSIEERNWAKWAYIYHRWGTLPNSGGAMEQSWIFWFFVDLVERVRIKKENLKNNNKELKRHNFILEYNDGK